MVNVHNECPICGEKDFYVLEEVGDDVHAHDLCEACYAEMVREAESNGSALPLDLNEGGLNA